MKDDTQIEGQLSLFDMMPAEDGDTLEGKTISQIAADISMLVGVNFNPKTWSDGEVQYVARLDKNSTLTLSEDHYDTEDESHGLRFLGCGYDFKNDNSGGGAPCDTIDDAVAYFRKRIEQYKTMRELRKQTKQIPKTFADYIGKCEYCMWYGYGLYEPYGHKRKPGTEGQMCQWEVSRKGVPPQCHNRDFWKPSIYTIPKLCGNCRHSNCFHYQKKPQYKEYDAKAFSDPVEEPNIYCTREDGSVNRQYPYKAFYSQHFGACLWDRQHEWDTCDAWERDWEILDKEAET